MRITAVLMLLLPAATLAVITFMDIAASHYGGFRLCPVTTSVQCAMALALVATAVLYWVKLHPSKGQWR